MLVFYIVSSNELNDKPNLLAAVNLILGKFRSLVKEEIKKTLIEIRKFSSVPYQVVT